MQNDQKENKVSSWLETLAREKEDKLKREEMEKQARAARLAILFESEADLMLEFGLDDEDDELDQEILD